MNLFSLLIILSILVPLSFKLISDYNSGLCLAVFLCIFLTHHIVLETGGNFPNFTIQRLILILLFITWLLSHQKSEQSFTHVPFFNILVLIGVVNLVSLLMSADFVFSLKQYLSFTVEIILFYTLIMTVLSSSNKDDIIRLLSYSCFALAVIAFFAIIERYTGFNPVDALVPGYVRQSKYSGDILSTYPHRILLGAAMAMGWPLALALADYFKKERSKSVLFWGFIIMLVPSCYFSFSRGPWIASLIAGGVMLILGSGNIKKKLIFVMVLISLILIMKPGVFDTIRNLFEETLNPSSFKGETYQYRWELWSIAYEEVSKSIGRFLFGYGPGMSEVFHFDRILSYSGDRYEVWSWDNQYAVYFLEGGLIGLALSITLYLSVLGSLFIRWRKVDKQYKNLIAGISASVVVMLFMMTNVKIFAPQLNYLFWTLISSAIALSRVVSFERREEYSAVIRENYLKNSNEAKWISS